MQMKLAAAIGAGIFVISFCVALQFSKVNRQDRLAQFQDSLQSEVSLLRSNVKFASEQWAQKLTRLASQKEMDAHNNSQLFASLFEENDFLLIGLFEPGDVSSWKLRWSEKKKNSPYISGFDPETKVVNFPLAAVRGDKVIWQRHLSSSGHAIYAFFIRLRVALSNAGDRPMPREVIAMGVVPHQAFYDALANMKMPHKELIVIDDKGYALAYSSQQYVGASLKNHPMVEKVLGERKTFDSGRFQNRNGEKVVGAYAQLDNSNLYVLSSILEESLPSLFWKKFMSLFGFIVGSFLVAFALGFTLFRKEMAAFEFLQDFTIAMARGLPIRRPEHDMAFPPVVNEAIAALQTGQTMAAPVEAKPAAPVGETVSTEEYKKKFRTEISVIAEGLVRSVRDPLNSILGHAQLAKTKSKNAELKGHYGSIEKEARKVKGTIDDLSNSIGAEGNLNLESLDVVELSLQALRTLRSETEGKDIRIEKKFSPVGRIEADAMLLKTAIAEVIKNAIESMSSSFEKTITFETKDEGNFVVLSIGDRGEGVESQKVEQLFSPFYTTRSDLGHDGMGLSVSRGIVEAMKGEMNLESKPNEGTKVTFRFPLHSKVAPVQQQPAASEIAEASRQDVTIDSPDLGSPLESSQVAFPDVPEDATVIAPKARPMIPAETIEEEDEEGFQEISLAKKDSVTSEEPQKEKEPVDLFDGEDLSFLDEPEEQLTISVRPPKVGGEKK